jgi:hypothetical protein
MHNVYIYGSGQPYIDICMSSGFRVKPKPNSTANSCCSHTHTHTLTFVSLLLTHTLTFVSPLLIQSVAGKPFVECLREQGVEPGIKVDEVCLKT